MGIIARQTIKGTIYSYAGALLGFVNIVLLMPRIFSTEEVGLTNLIVSLSVIIGQFGSLGFTNVTSRLFPLFRTEDKKHKGFLFLLLTVGLIGFILCVIVYYLIKDYLILDNIERSPLFSKYVYLLLPFVFIYIFHTLIDTYNRVLFNASFGLFVKEFLLRILNSICIALFYLNFLDFTGFIHFYTLAYAVPLLLLLLLLLYKGEISLKPNFKFLGSGLKKEILQVAFFGILTGFSTMAAMHIDRYMVNYYCDLSATGVYSIAFYFGTMILLPGRALMRISTTYIIESFKANDLADVGKIYKKSAINQLIVAIVIFLFIWGNVDSLLKMLPAAYHEGKYVILFISLAYLLIMGSGLSSEIITLSKYFKHYAYIILVLVALIVVFNYLFIPKYGINGAAFASFFAYLIYISFKYFFILIKFGFQPFGVAQIKTLALGGLVYMISIYIPVFDKVFFNLIIKSAFLFVGFMLPVYLFKLSPDINVVIDAVLRFVKFKK